MFVLTIDQRASRTESDRIDTLIRSLHTGPEGGRLVRPFERTAGDEVQGLVADADVVVAMVLTLVRDGHWSIGVGAGPVDEPIPASVRAASGAAFVHAREAVARAKSSPRRLAVAAPDEGDAGDAEALLALLAAIVQRRSQNGWEVADLMVDGLTQQEAAARIGISPQAVSQRLQASLWNEERRARPLAGRVLRAADR